MTKSLSVSTLNVRSIAKDKKRKMIMHWIEKYHSGIILMQETHADNDLIEKWNKECKYKIYASNGTQRSGGVATLIHEDIQHELKEVYTDNKGHFLILNLILGSDEIIIANCYFPTKDKQKEQLSVLNELLQNLMKYENITKIIGGDFNLVLDPKLDKQGGTNAALESKNFRNELKAMLESFDLIDILRSQKNEQSLFTWHSKYLKVYSRLDYFFISNNLSNRVIKCSKHTGIMTDHDLVKINISTSLPSRGRGFWKFNSSLLKDNNYIQLVKETINTTVVQLGSMADKGMLWDIIKMNIRAKTISYSAKKKRARDELENRLMKSINQLENVQQTETVIDQITKLKEELEDLYKYRAEGIILRSKIQWAEEGEKNSSYFLKLENYNAQKKTIIHIKDSKGKMLTEQEDILEHINDYYESLYSQGTLANNELNDDNFLQSNVNKLSLLEQTSCEGIVTKNECAKSLKEMANQKSPGTDGFSTEFYKFFWNDISEHVVSSFNYAFNHGNLSIDQMRGIISLTPKKDKDKLYIKNWRPIALLNTDYKLLAKILSTRLKNVISKIINPDQTGYITGRYIGENIRTVADTIEYITQNKESALIILIDFEKAFDTIKWSFIDKALKNVNLGPDFRKWVNILYKDSKSTVINNGHFTKFFKLQRGVRQGCPLSVYLFLVVVEHLACHIRNNKNISGILLNNDELKISQMADDTTIFLKSHHSIQPLINALNDFYKCSGLKTNVDKTKLYEIGNIRLTQNEKYGLNVEKGSISLLGVTITTNIKKHKELNLDPKIKIMRTMLSLWTKRNLSLKGKITVINSLIISLFTYPTSILGIDTLSLNEIDKAIFEFLWSHKKAKIAKSVIIRKIEDGGLQMPSIFLKAKSWKIMWLKRALLYPDRKWVMILNALLKDIKFNDLLRTNVLGNENFLLQRLPNFYKEAITDWKSIKHINIKTAQGIKSQMIWLNSFITIQQKPFIWKSWYNKGVIEINDLLNENGDFLSHDNIRDKYNIECSFLEMLQLRQSIPLQWRALLKHCQKDKMEPEGILNKDGKVKSLKNLSSKEIYWELITLKKTSIPKCIIKWHETFNEVFILSDSVIHMWKQIFKLPFQTCEETQLQSFQFKILHRIIACNHWLHIINIKDSPLCTDCNEDDTLLHFFINCNLVTSFWTSFANWLSRLIKQNLILDEPIIMFGIENSSSEIKMINYLLIVGKWYIYTQKLANQKLIDFYRFLPFLKEKLHIKYLSHKYNNTQCLFERKWGKIYNNI